MPRNSRSSRSSASMVTLVASSPFHQPAGSCKPSRCPRARSLARRTAASCPDSAPVGVGRSAIAVISRSSSCPPLPLPPQQKPGHLGEIAEGLRPRRQAVEPGKRLVGMQVGALLAPGAAAGLLHELGGERDILLRQL